MTVDDALRRLTAGLAEEERIALAASPGPWCANAEHDEVVAVDDITVCDGFALSGNQLRATVDHIVAQDPKATLRRVEAIRKVIDEHRRTSAGNCDVCRDYDFHRSYNPVQWPCPTIRALADIYPEDTDETEKL